MSTRFDDIPAILGELAQMIDSESRSPHSLIAIRDLWGRVRFIVPGRPDPDPNSPGAVLLSRLASEAATRLAPHEYPPEEAILYTDEITTAVEDLESLPSLLLSSGATTIRLIDRQITGSYWASISETVQLQHKTADRIVFYSLKGGVGRTTATAIAAWHLATHGRNVLVVDLDLEAPGLSSGLLPSQQRPRFGIVDWFVEDAVGAGDSLIGQMEARSPLAADLPGDVWVVPGYGARPGEYIPKLGRCYLDLPSAETSERWENRLGRMLLDLEEHRSPDVVLIDSRSGLHDLASTAVTELAGMVLLFAVGTPQTWEGYRLLFEHWQRFKVAERIRERLQVVAALVPETDKAEHLSGFRQNAWDLFRDHLYDEVNPEEIDGFSFDVADDSAPHSPWPIYWNRGFASLASFEGLDSQLIRGAFGSFLDGLDQWIGLLGETS